MQEVQLNLKIEGGQKEVDDLLDLLVGHLHGYAQLESFSVICGDDVQTFKSNEV